MLVAAGPIHTGPALNRQTSTERRGSAAYSQTRLKRLNGRWKNREQGFKGLTVDLYQSAASLTQPHWPVLLKPAEEVCPSRTHSFCPGNHLQGPGELDAFLCFFSSVFSLCFWWPPWIHLTFCLFLSHSQHITQHVSYSVMKNVTSTNLWDRVFRMVSFVHFSHFPNFFWDGVGSV